MRVFITFTEARVVPDSFFSFVLKKDPRYAPGRFAKRKKDPKRERKILVNVLPFLNFLFLTLRTLSTKNIRKEETRIWCNRRDIDKGRASDDTGNDDEWI
tara:strand:+ start:376 stop:675 length:300 start_codon:yes stop_codon:yes gene_type:complete